MPRSYRQYCALARTLDAVGDRWSMLIIRNLLLGPQRWGELRSTLPGIAKNLLSARLSQLEQDDIVLHEGEHYQLTARGTELERALFALGDWGERHLMGPPEQQEAIRLRYLMTSVRRKLRPSPNSATIQLWVDDAPFLVTLGAAPAVTQGSGDADVVVRCGFCGLRGLLFEGSSAAELVDADLIAVHGDVSIVDEFAGMFRGARASHLDVQTP